MTFVLPLDVENIIHTLEVAGYEAYAVGGCVRDSLLGIMPYDWDVTTSANPEQVKDLFLRTLDTGLLHGTVTVMIKEQAYEVTTYRVDGDYTDYRRPDAVHFTSHLFEDLKRRDFTINAMAYHPNTGVVDAFNGMSDLKSGRIRCVGSATERFKEDALRMLRAIRFAARFGFVIEADTVTGICLNAHLIHAVSAERIQVELNKILESDHPDYIRYLMDYGLMGHLMPELLDQAPMTKTLEALKQMPKDKVLRWTVLLNPLGVHKASAILERFRFDNDTKRRTLKLIAYLDMPLEADMAVVRRQMNRLGTDLFHAYLIIREGLLVAHNSSLQALYGVKGAYENILEAKHCVSTKDLAVSGKDLILLGLKEGRVIGHMLHWLLHEVLQNPSLNEKQTLLDLAAHAVASGHIDWLPED